MRIRISIDNLIEIVRTGGKIQTGVPDLAANGMESKNDILPLIV